MQYISRSTSDIIKMVENALRGPSNKQFGMLFIKFNEKCGFLVHNVAVSKDNFECFFSVS